ncbi:hypothetical protein IFM89_030156 [Coptis chinensis]|uniref:Uncharacterized protein n=1 Tax=Coptis chinensis TaxID=261450 RepID=A0A835LJV9_9MAGN|nr:hypothetical protein IFM89_030156 [Coptis chinensis]
MRTTRSQIGHLDMELSYLRSRAPPQLKLRLVSIGMDVLELKNVGSVHVKGRHAKRSLCPNKASCDVP